MLIEDGLHLLEAYAPAAERRGDRRPSQRDAGGAVLSRGEGILTSSTKLRSARFYRGLGLGPVRAANPTAAGPGGSAAPRRCPAALRPAAAFAVVVGRHRRAVGAGVVHHQRIATWGCGNERETEPWSSWVKASPDSHGGPPTTHSPTAARPRPGHPARSCGDGRVHGRAHRVVEAGVHQRELAAARRV